MPENLKKENQEVAPDNSEYNLTEKEQNRKNIEAVSQKLTENSKILKGAVDEGNEELSRATFNDFVEISRPTIEKWLMRFDRSKNDNDATLNVVNQTRYSHFIDDALQETYLKIYANLPKFFDTFDPEKAPLLGWLFAISRNAYIDQIRRQQRIEKVELDQDEAQLSIQKDLIDGGIAVGEELILEETSQILEKIISGLKSPQRREIARMICLEGLTDAEVYDRKKSIKTKNTIHQLVHRVREDISDGLRDAGFEERLIALPAHRQK